VGAARDLIAGSYDSRRGRLEPLALFVPELRERFAKDRESMDELVQLERDRDQRERQKEELSAVRDLQTLGEAGSQAGPEAANSVGERIAAIFSSRAAADVLPRVEVDSKGITAAPGEKVGGVFQRTKDIVMAGEKARDVAGVGRGQLAQKQAATDELAAQSGSPAQAKFANETQLGGNAASRAQSQEDQRRQIAVHKTQSLEDQRRQITVDQAQSMEIQRRTFAIDAHDEGKVAKRAAQSRAALEAMLPQSGVIPEEQRKAVEWALSVLPPESTLNTAIFERVLEGNLRRVPETSLTGTATVGTQTALQQKAVDLMDASAQLDMVDALVRTPDGELDDSMFGFAASLGEGAADFANRLGVDTQADETLQRYRTAQTNLDASAQTYARSESGLQLPEEQYARLRKNWPTLKEGKYRYAAKMEVVKPMLVRKLNLASKLSSGSVTLEEAKAEYFSMVGETIAQLEEANDRALIEEARSKGLDVTAILNEDEDAQ
jgi:hypothetical protein